MIIGFSLNSQKVLLKKKSVGTVRIIATEGLDSLHTDKTTPHARPLYIVNIYGKHERLCVYPCVLKLSRFQLQDKTKRLLYLNCITRSL